MAGLRYIVPALAVAASAAAQSCGSSGSTTTIQSNSDATGIASCSTYSGSIAIATGTTDSIMLNGIQKINGDLVANNVTNMASMSADSLQEIGGDFNLESLTILSTLSFPVLVKVDSIMWTALPALSGLSFTDSIQEVTTSLQIDNTFLSSLEGIDLQVADTIMITNNPYLTSINMQLGNVTTSLTIGANGEGLTAEFPNLEWAYNMTLRNCSEVSIPSLASVNGSLGFYSDDFQSLSAPNLTDVGGSLSFVSCESLANVSMPELTTIGGGFQIANNTDLAKISGFPLLKAVGGALDFDGAFTSVALPAISDVRGAFNLISSKNIDSSCSTFEPKSGNNKAIKGTYTCKGEDASSSTSSTDGSTDSSGSSSSTTSSAAHPILIPGATGLLGVVAAIFGLL